MIFRIALKGIQCFKEEKVIRFAPLTLLTGMNSSGKSSVFQADMPPLLRLEESFGVEFSLEEISELVSVE